LGIRLILQIPLGCLTDPENRNVAVAFIPYMRKAHEGACERARQIMVVFDRPSASGLLCRRISMEVVDGGAEFAAASNREEEVASEATRRKR
jgi:hypothetical protein